MKKSTKNTNQIQKLIDQNRHYQRTSNWSFFALLCTRKFVPKIRTPKIRTRNPYQKFISKTRTENLYIEHTNVGCVLLMVAVSMLLHMKFGRYDHREYVFHFTSAKKRNSVIVEISQNSRETNAKMITRVMTGFLRIHPIHDFRDNPENGHSTNGYFRSKFWKSYVGWICKKSKNSS